VNIGVGKVGVAPALTIAEVEYRPVPNQVRNQKSRSGVNEILDDALGAFIDFLDQHTLADMVRSDPRGSGAGRRRNANAARGPGMTSARYRRSLQESS